MKKFYLFLSMLLLATALQATTNSEPNNLQVTTVSATPDDGNQEGYYNLTVNVNVTDTTLANIMILLRSDKQFNSYVSEYDIYNYTEITNHTPISLPRGNYYIALMSYAGYSRGEFPVIEKREVVMDSDKTEDFKVNVVTNNITAPEEIQNGISFSAVSVSMGASSYVYYIDDYILVTDGQYKIGIKIPTDEGYPKYIYKTVNITEDTSLDYKIGKLSIVCQDKNGEVAPDIRLKLTTNKSSDYDSYTTDNNGRVETYALDGDTIRISISDNNFDISNYIVVMNGNKDISLSVPNKISFKLYFDGKLFKFGDEKFRFDMYNYDNHPMNYDYDDNGNIYIRYDGKFPLRLYAYNRREVSQECFEGFVAGYFTPTDGCTVRVASVNVQSDGKGLVFPRNDFQPQQIYKMFVDNVVRLAAIPVGNGEFINWEINGKTYSQPMIDYTVKEDDVTAIAHFSGEITNYVKGVEAPTTEQITVSIEGGMLRLPEFIEGDASFYSVDGRLVKQVGVVGDRIVISDLPAGAYVLTIAVEGRTLSARFVKP